MNFPSISVDQYWFLPHVSSGCFVLPNSLDLFINRYSDVSTYFYELIFWQTTFSKYQFYFFSFLRKGVLEPPKHPPGYATAQSNSDHENFQTPAFSSTTKHTQWQVIQPLPSQYFWEMATSIEAVIIFKLPLFLLEQTTGQWGSERFSYQDVLYASNFA